MPSITRGSQKYSNAPGEGGAAEASGDHAINPLAIDGPFDDGDTGSDADAMPTETPEEHLSDSRMAAISAALAEAMTSTLAQMQAAQDQRTAAMTGQLSLLTAALARGTPPASRGGVSAGDTAVAPSTRGPPHHGTDLTSTLAVLPTVLPEHVYSYVSHIPFWVRGRP